MNRLDAVVGPENWADDYLPFGEAGVKCLLTITLPDGTKLTKAGIGGISKMNDASDTEKSGESDALKRAAVKFGIGRILYGDGVPGFEKHPAPAPPAAKPKDQRSYWQMVVSATEKRNENQGSSITPERTHWMLTIMASKEFHFELPNGDDAIYKGV